MRIDTGDHALHVVDEGDPGAPPLVLLHGITSSTATWSWLVPDLTPSWRVLRVDFRGHGGSDHTPGEYAMSGYVADAAAVCRTLDAPAVVIGHSLGGGTALALAQQHPDLVRALVLEDPPLMSSDDPPTAQPLGDNSLLGAFALMRESIPRLQADGVAPEVLADILRAAPSATGPAFGEFLHDDAIVAMAESMLALDASVLDPVLQGTSAPVYRSSLGVDVPTLLITADAAAPDRVAAPAAVEVLCDRSTDVRVLTPAGAGHLVHDELAHRETFRAAVLAFVDDIHGERPARG